MIRTIACPENSDLLALAAGDDPPPTVRSHVASCPRCRRAVRRLKAEIGCLRSSLAAEPLPLASRLGLRSAASGG